MDCGYVECWKDTSLSLGIDGFDLLTIPIVDPGGKNAFTQQKALLWRRALVRGGQGLV